MWKTVVFLGALAFVAGQQTTEVSQCLVFPGELPINTYVEGCITPPCGLPQSQDALINIIFRAPRTMRRMQTLATAFMSLGPITAPIPYPLGDNAETCNFLTNSYCPVIKDEVLQYQLRMFIEENFPQGTQLPIEFRVVDEDSVAVICVRFVIRVDPPIGETRMGNFTLTDV